MTDAREALDCIKARARGDDLDGLPGDWADARWIADALRSLDRLTEALEAVLGAHEPFELSWGYGPVEFCKQCSDQGVPQEQAEWPCPTVKAIEAELSKEEA